jgi:serine protease Do
MSCEQRHHRFLATVGAAVLAVFCSPLAHATSELRRTPVVRAVEKTRSAVVNLYTETIVQTPFRPRGPESPWDEFFGELFRNGPSGPGSRKRASLGSGVIIDPTGMIVTNAHVLTRASNIRVLMADKKEFEATLIGADSDSDLAVLRIEPPERLPTVELPQDHSILIGETAIAIGNPFGLSHTVTVGVVSATGRTIRAGDMVYHDFIQTDASINPGNSGGPLINVEGHLLGINTAIHREGEGIGFAIPVSRVRSIVDQIVNFGAVQPPWIGIQVQNLTHELAFHFGRDPDSGVLVSNVEPDSPAERSGIERGVIIVAAQGERVRTGTDFADRTSGLAAGEELNLRIVDDGDERDVRLEVATFPAERIDDFSWRSLGMAVKHEARAPAVVVARVRAQGPAAEIGIRPGDVIVGLGGHEIDGIDTFRRKLAALRNANAMLVSVVRGQRLYRVTLPLYRGVLKQRP